MSLFICLLFLNTPAPGQESNQKILLEIPLRFGQTQTPSPIISPQNLIFSINGKKREIAYLVPVTKSLAAPPVDLKRHFILSFQVTEYSGRLEEGLGYILTEIINPGDYLYLLSSEKIYQFHITPNKEQSIQEISALLKADIQKVNKGRRIAEKALLNKMKRLEQSIRNPNLSDSPFLMAHSFLNSIAQEFQNYFERYLKLSTSNFQQIVTLLGFNEGERWWLHFQERKSFELIYRTRQVSDSIKYYISSINWTNLEHPKLLTQKNNQFLKNITAIAAYSPRSYQEALLEGAIRFNVVSLTGTGNDGSMFKGTGLTETDMTLAGITQATGGSKTTANTMDQGMKKLMQHKDRFYSLGFYFNGKIEEKKIEIKPLSQQSSMKNTLFYRKRFQVNMLSNYIDYLRGEKISFSNYSQQRNAVRFTLDKFRMDRVEDKKYGLINVRIQLFSPRGKPLFKQEKVLRARDRHLKISFPFPGKFKGKYRLKISACDLIANRLADLERQIIL